MELICKKCGSTEAYKSGHVNGLQRYKCKNCGHQYTKTTPQGKPKKDKILAQILWLSGLSMNVTAKIVGVTAQSVMRWVRQSRQEYVFDTPEISHIQEVDTDEVYHYFQKKVKKYGCEKLLVIEAKTSSGRVFDIVIPKYWK